MAHTRQQQETTVESKTFVHDSQGVSFKDGTMHVRKRPLWPEKVEQWESSNGLTVYTAIVWYDQATGKRHTSCNCPGWTFKRGKGHRECTHTKDAEGRASCSRRKVNSQVVTTVRDAVALVPDMQYGKLLRAIELDCTDPDD